MVKPNELKINRDDVEKVAGSIHRLIDTAVEEFGVRSEDALIGAMAYGKGSEYALLQTGHTNEHLELVKKFVDDLVLEKRSRAMYGDLK